MKLTILHRHSMSSSGTTLTYHLPPIESWSDWTAAYNDVSLWRPIVDAICASEGIRYRSIEAPRSNTNAVFILDRRLVVKIYSPFWSEFDIEPKLIKVLSTEGQCSRPGCVIASGRYQDRADLDLPGNGALSRTNTRSAQTRDQSRRGHVHRRADRRRNETPFTRPESISLEGADAGETWDDLVARRRREVLPELIDRGLVTSRSR